MLSIKSDRQDTVPMDKTLRFAAVCCENESIPTSLSPKVMAWDPKRHIWLSDLRTSLPYFRKLATLRQQDLRKNLEDCLQQVLDKEAGKDDAAIAMRGTYAVFSDHPWLALLLLEYALTRGAEGIHFIGKQEDNLFFRQVTWDVWMRAAKRMGHHWLLAKVKGFRYPAYLKQLDRLHTMAQRLGLKSPWDLQRFPIAGIKRRYGVFVSYLCQWHQLDRDAGGQGFRESFPWRLHQPLDMPQVTRHLDYGLSDWQHIQEMLREDLNKLCKLPNLHHSEHVVCLEWRLTLASLSQRSVWVRFRHPHCLHNEMPHQSTALLQAGYSFTGASSSFLNQEEVNEICHEAFHEAIVSWSLRVKEKTILPQVTRDLFGLTTSQTELRDLSNKLPVSLKRYEMTPAWPVSRAYQLKKEGDTKSAKTKTLSAGVQGFLCQVASCLRPLFVLKKPQKLDPGHQPYQKANHNLTFLERVDVPWWELGKNKDEIFAVESAKTEETEAEGAIAEPMAAQGGYRFRDYYLYKKNEKMYWIYIDCQDGQRQDQWYVHGYFH